MILKLKNNKEIFESICDVMSYTLSRGDITWWEYNTSNGHISNFENFTRVDLAPMSNNYWINLKHRTETHLYFEINFRYYLQREDVDVFSNMLLLTFKNDLEVAEQK